MPGCGQYDGEGQRPVPVARLQAPPNMEVVLSSHGKAGELPPMSNDVAAFSSHCKAGEPPASWTSWRLQAWWGGEAQIRATLPAASSP